MGRRSGDGRAALAALLVFAAIAARLDVGSSAGVFSDSLQAGTLGVNQLSSSTFDAAGGVNGEAVLCFVSSPADGSIIAAVGAQDPASTSKPYIVKLAPPTWTTATVATATDLSISSGRTLLRGSKNCTIDAAGRYAYFADSVNRVLQINATTLALTGVYDLAGTERHRIVGVHAYGDSVYVVYGRHPDAATIYPIGVVDRLNNVPAPFAPLKKKSRSLSSSDEAEEPEEQRRGPLALPSYGRLQVNQTVSLPDSVGRPCASVLAPKAGLLFVATEGLGVRALRLDNITSWADVPRDQSTTTSPLLPYSAAVAEQDGRLYLLALPMARKCKPCAVTPQLAHRRGLLAADPPACSNCGADGLVPEGQACSSNCPTPTPTPTPSPSPSPSPSRTPSPSPSRTPSPSPSRTPSPSPSPANDARRLLSSDGFEDHVDSAPLPSRGDAVPELPSAPEGRASTGRRLLAADDPSNVTVRVFLVHFSLAGGSLTLTNNATYRGSLLAVAPSKASLPFLFFPCASVIPGADAAPTDAKAYAIVPSSVGTAVVSSLQLYPTFAVLGAAGPPPSASLVSVLQVVRSGLNTSSVFVGVAPPVPPPPTPSPSPSPSPTPCTPCVAASRRHSRGLLVVASPLASDCMNCQDGAIPAGQVCQACKSCSTASCANGPTQCTQAGRRHGLDFAAVSDPEVVQHPESSVVSTGRHPLAGFSYPSAGYCLNCRANLMPVNTSAGATQVQSCNQTCPRYPCVINDCPGSENGIPRCNAATCIDGLMKQTGVGYPGAPSIQSSCTCGDGCRRKMRGLLDDDDVDINHDDKELMIKSIPQEPHNPRPSIPRTSAARTLLADPSACSGTYCPAILHLVLPENCSPCKLTATFGAVLPVNSSSLNGTITRQLSGSGFPASDPALALYIGGVGVSNLTAAANGSLLSFSVPAPARIPGNKLAVDTPYDIVLATSCGNATFPKSYVFWVPVGKFQVIGIQKGVQAKASEAVSIGCNGCNFQLDDIVIVYIQLPDPTSQGWQVPGYTGPAGTCGVKAPNASVISSEKVDFASPLFAASCIRNNLRRALRQRALNTFYDVVLVSAQQGPFVIPSAFAWLDPGLPTSVAPYQSVTLNGLPGYVPAVVIPVVIGGCVLLLVACCVLYCAVRRRWRRLPPYVDVRIVFDDAAPSGGALEAAVAKALGAPRVAAVARGAEKRSAVVRVHDAQHQGTGEVRRATEDVPRWAAGVSGGGKAALAGRRVESAEVLFGSPPGATQSAIFAVQEPVPEHQVVI